MSLVRDHSGSPPTKPIALRNFPPQLLNSPYLPSQDINDLIKFTKYVKNDSKTRRAKSKSASLSSQLNRSNIKYNSRRFFSGHTRPSKPSTNHKFWKQAISLAEEAAHAGKVFTCEAPYPVDLFVRLSLRKRGWIEKFGLKLNRMASCSDKTSSISCNGVDLSTEVIDLICTEKYPKVWEENEGLYYIMSSCIQQHPATFVWGNKSVNNMILRENVFVNHFPKSKYFSSKVLLASCLKELIWHRDSHSTSFFPRCYLLNEADREDFIEDFQLTACMGLLKQVLLMNGFKESESHADWEYPTGPKVAKVNCFDHSSTEIAHTLKDGMPSAQVCEDDYDDDFDDDDADDLKDADKKKVDRVLPDLLSMMRIKKGGIISKQCFEWAMNHCENFLAFKSHRDIDSKKAKQLHVQQMNQLMDSCLQVSVDGASMEFLAHSRLEACKKLLVSLKKFWPQFGIDGTKNLWILKPGDLSKGLGISMSNDLREILQHLIKQQSTHEYVIQKYIERPLLFYKCKFDIRQWFLVTSWMPLTIWMYQKSYLRICSQEFNYETLHESVHLSNVAVQENYLNGERSNKIPENNFMMSDGLKKYLDEIGHGNEWDERIYPGMKLAIINTLVSTQEFVNGRKNGFELYGADFMLSEDFHPWLLEINSSPGMCPTCPEKVRLCSSVIEDSIRVVLDLRDDSKDLSGGYELIHKSFTNPSTRGTTNKLILEGSQIKKNYLQKFSAIDKRAAQDERNSNYEDGASLILPDDDDDHAIL